MGVDIEYTPGEILGLLREKTYELTLINGEALCGVLRDVTFDQQGNPIVLHVDNGALVLTVPWHSVVYFHRI